MKRVLFYHMFIGDDNSSMNDIEFRIQHTINQLRMLNETLRKNEFHLDRKFVVPVCPVIVTGVIRSKCSEFGFDIYDGFVRENWYEYPTFLAMRNYSQDFDGLLFYCHSKGSFNRTNDSNGIFNFHTSTLLNESVIDNFQDPAIQNIGLYPSQHGFLWHNFFWVRSSFMAQKDVPIFEDRYDYESLIGDKNNPLAYRECKGLAYIEGFQHKEFYSSDDLNLNNKVLLDLYAKYVSLHD